MAQLSHNFKPDPVNPFAYWSCLLITFVNSLDPDQARPNVGPDLDQNCLTRSDIPERIFRKS